MFHYVLEINVEIVRHQIHHLQKEVNCMGHQERL